MSQKNEDPIEYLMTELKSLHGWLTVMSNIIDESANARLLMPSAQLRLTQVISSAMPVLQQACDLATILKESTVLLPEKLDTNLLRRKYSRPPI
jgi:hypothetical protein